MLGRHGELVIAVPKIPQDRIPQRLVDPRRPQMAEQLVEVPTVLSPSLLQQQSAEQTVDFLVPGRGGGGGRGGLQGFPEQGLTDRGGVGLSSSRRLRLTDAAARRQAQDLGPEFWPKRACKFFVQGGCQQD